MTRFTTQWRQRIVAGLLRFKRDDRGSYSMLFALATVPLVVSAGAAMDFGLASKAKAKLGAIADAAAIAAVNHDEMAYNATAAQATAINVFNAQATGLRNVTVSSVTANVTDSGLSRTAVVSYTATIPTLVMKLAGITSTTIKGQSTALSGQSTYIDFYLLLDNTPSMGVGATPGDVATMVNNTPDQCAFACHDVSNSNNYYNKAKQLGVTMRIDTVRNATQQLMDKATATAMYPNQYQMAIYSFGASSAAAGLTAITALTSNLNSAKTAAANIDLMTVNGQNQFNDQDTNFDGILPAINAVIPSPGPGTATSPQKVLFFVSDGVADESNTSCLKPKSGTYRCQSPINPLLCKTLKDRQIKIAVLYTTYLDLPTNDWYNNWIKPFNTGPYDPSVNSEIAKKMQECASPGLYFEVTPSQGISDAMNALFQKAISDARISN